MITHKVHSCDDESKVFFLRIIGHYYYNISRFTEPHMRKQIVKKALNTYNWAYQIALPSGSF